MLFKFLTGGSTWIALPNGQGYHIPRVADGMHVPADPVIVAVLTDLLIQPSGPSLSLNDFGAGVGQYGRALLSRDPSLQYRGYDGAGNVEAYTGGFVRFFDATASSLELPRADWLLSLEVGEHIPTEWEGSFLRNLHAHNCRGVILSWARLNQLGKGHVNNHETDYLADKFAQLGYFVNHQLTRDLRAQEFVAADGSVERRPSWNTWFSRSALAVERHVPLVGSGCLPVMHASPASPAPPPTNARWCDLSCLRSELMSQQWRALSRSCRDQQPARRKRRLGLPLRIFIFDWQTLAPFIAPVLGETGVEWFRTYQIWAERPLESLKELNLSLAMPLESPDFVIQSQLREVLASPVWRERVDVIERPELADVVIWSVWDYALCVASGFQPLKFQTLRGMLPSSCPAHIQLLASLTEMPRWQLRNGSDYVLLATSFHAFGSDMLRSTSFSGWDTELSSAVHIAMDRLRQATWIILEGREGTLELNRTIVAPYHVHALHEVMRGQHFSIMSSRSAPAKFSQNLTPSKFACFQAVNFNGRCVHISGRRSCSSKQTSLLACQQLCEQYPLCVAVVWNKHNECYLKSQGTFRHEMPPNTHRTVGCVLKSDHSARHSQLRHALLGDDELPESLLSADAQTAWTRSMASSVHAVWEADSTPTTPRRPHIACFLGGVTKANMVRQLGHRTLPTKLRARIVADLRSCGQRLCPVFEATKRSHDAVELVSDAYKLAFLQSTMQNSTFCPVPRGHSASSRRLFDAIAMGCIPVIISDALVLPFAEHVDYEGAIVRVSETRVLNQSFSLIRWLITSFRGADIRRMQAKLLCLRASLSTELHGRPHVLTGSVNFERVTAIQGDHNNEPCAPQAAGASVVNLVLASVVARRQCGPSSR